MFFTRQRLEDRTIIAVQARVRFGGREAPAMLANASAHGVLALFDAPPERGTRIEIEVGDALLKGQVRWRSGRRCGVSLTEPIEISDVLDGRSVAVTFISQRDSGLGSRGIFRDAVCDGPLVRRVVPMALLIAAVASGAFAISRLGPAALSPHVSQLAVLDHSAR